MPAEPTLSEDLLGRFSTHVGENLLTVLNSKPHLVIFLRHSGCTFCREAVAEAAQSRTELEAQGIGLVFVHPSSETLMRPVFERYGVTSAPRVSDPDLVLFQAFGLRKGKASQLFGPTVVVRGIQAALLRGHRIGRPNGKVLQMPGVFLMDGLRIVRAYRHRMVSDRPDYCELAKPPAA